MTSPAEDVRVPLPDGFSVPESFEHRNDYEIDGIRVQTFVRVQMIDGQPHLWEYAVRPLSAVLIPTSPEESQAIADLGGPLSVTQLDRMPPVAVTVQQAMIEQAASYAAPLASADLSTSAGVGEWLQQAGEALIGVRRAMESPRAITPQVLAQVADAYERGGIAAVQALRGGCSERNARRLLRRAREAAQR